MSSDLVHKTPMSKTCVDTATKTSIEKTVELFPFLHLYFTLVLNQFSSHSKICRCDSPISNRNVAHIITYSFIIAISVFNKEIYYKAEARNNVTHLIYLSSSSNYARKIMNELTSAERDKTEHQTDSKSYDIPYQMYVHLYVVEINFPTIRMRITSDFEE